MTQVEIVDGVAVMPWLDGNYMLLEKTSQEDHYEILKFLKQVLVFILGTSSLLVSVSYSKFYFVFFHQH